MKKILSSIMVVAILCTAFLSTIALAQNTTIMQNELKKSKAVVSNIKVDYKIISDTEVEITTTNKDMNRTIKAIATIDKETITSKYYLEGKLILTDKRSLKEATEFGNKFKSDLSQISRNSKNSVTTNAYSTSRYTFDGLQYTPQGQYVPYKHPDKNYYGISPYSTYSIDGNSYNHMQIDTYTSDYIAQLPSAMIGTAIGGIIGAYVSGASTAIIGGVIGAAFGVIFGVEITRIFDEDGCIWVIMDDPEIVTYPTNYLIFEYIAVGPYSVTNYYYPI